MGYEVQIFYIFETKGNPHDHLRSYCNKLVGVGRDEVIRLMFL